MNHDVSHCSDYNPDTCPKSCFRAQVTADLFAREDLINLPFSFMAFRTNGDPECPLSPAYTLRWNLCPAGRMNNFRCKQFKTCSVCWAAYLKEVVE